MSKQRLTFTKEEANKMIGRVFTALDGLVYTATSCSTRGWVTVFDPRKNEYIHFDSRETFENWAYGTPVSSAQPAAQEVEPSAPPSGPLCVAIVSATGIEGSYAMCSKPATVNFNGKPYCCELHARDAKHNLNLSRAASGQAGAGPSVPCPKCGEKLEIDWNIDAKYSVVCLQGHGFDVNTMEDMRQFFPVSAPASQPSAELENLRSELKAAKEDAASWKRHWQMYRDAWVRELGGWTIPKSHEIDSLVLTTRKRCVNPLLGNCGTPHWLGKPTEDGKALQQTPHPHDNSCKEWKVDSSEPEALSAPKAPAGQPEALAQRFHEIYERLAPQFGYETRKASAKPWAEVPDQNKRLMIAACAELLRRNLAQ